MTDPPDISPRDRLVVATGHAVSAVFLALGILGSLRTHLDHVAQLAMFTVSPGIAVAWLVIGVVGVSMVVKPRPARIYLLATGGILLLWGVLGLLLDGAGAEFFVRDIPLVTLHLVAGAVSVAACLVPGAAPMPQNPSGSSPERTP